MPHLRSKVRLPLSSLSFPGSAWERTTREALPRGGDVGVCLPDSPRTAGPCWKCAPRQSLRTGSQGGRSVPLALIFILSLVPAAQAQFDAVFGSGTSQVVPAAAWFATAAQTPHPSVVRVISPERNGASLGSGTLVDVSDKHGLVLTNWHVVKDAAGNVIVSFPDGFQTPGYVVKMDREWDLAAVVIWKPQAKPVPIAPQVPRQGEPLTIAGYGSGNYKAQAGRCVQYLSPAPNRPADIVEVSAAARHGDSGGPILNSRGELAGVLFGEGGGMTSGSAAARVRWFVESLGMKQNLEPGIQIAAAGAGDKGQGAGGAPLNANRSAAPETNWKESAQEPALVAVATPPPYPDTGAPPIRLLPPIPRAETAAGAASGQASQPQPLLTNTPTSTRLPTTSRPPLVSTAPSLPPADAAQQITFEDLIGHTGGQQLKTALAVIGVLFVLYQLSRRIA